MGSLRAATGVFVFALQSAVAGQAWAQESKATNTVDAVRGTIRGSTRYIGLGGAFVAIADRFFDRDVAAEERPLQRPRKRRFEQERVARWVARCRGELPTRGLRVGG